MNTWNSVVKGLTQIYCNSDCCVVCACVHDIMIHHYNQTVRKTEPEN